MGDGARRRTYRGDERDGIERRGVHRPVPSRGLGHRGQGRGAAGVEFLWFINLEHRTLTALRLGEQGYVLVQAVGPEPAARVPPFEHADLDVGLFFGVEPGEAG
jgi:hypothetical protein